MAWSKYAIKALLRLAYRQSVNCKHCEEVFARGEEGLKGAVEALEAHMTDHHATGVEIKLDA